MSLPQTLRCLASDKVMTSCFIVQAAAITAYEGGLLLYMLELAMPKKHQQDMMPDIKQTFVLMLRCAGCSCGCQSL